MLSPVLKELLPKYYEGYTADNVVVVSIMPCTAKKVECRRKQLETGGVADTNFVLTTQELGRMIKEAGIDFKNLQPEEENHPFGDYSGAGTIFGASGGVAEAAARTAYEFVTGKELQDVDIKAFRGTSNRSRTVELDLNGTKVVVRVVSTFGRSRKSFERNHRS